MTTYVRITYDEDGLHASPEVELRVLLERDPHGAVVLVEQLAAELRTYAEQLDRLAVRTRVRITRVQRAEAAAAADRRAREDDA